jgi:hypothetical protein
MPFRAKRRHQFWSADVRYVDHRLGGEAYVISVLDNHSRAILSSALTRTQDLASYLSVLLYAAVERYGSPEALVTDGGGIFSGPRRRGRSTRHWASPSTRDRARQALAELRRDDLQRPEEDGRLALRRGRELARELRACLVRFTLPSPAASVSTDHCYLDEAFAGLHQPLVVFA